MAIRNPNTWALYKHRNDILRSMGFSSYAEYLKSDLWHSISKDFLEGKRCVACDAKATIIHHVCYTENGLLGEDTRHMLPCCKACHVWSHFYKGEHLNPLEAASRLDALAEDRKVLGVSGIRRRVKSDIEWQKRKFPGVAFKANRYPKKRVIGDKLPTQFTAQSLIEGSRLGGELRAAWLSALERNL